MYPEWKKKKEAHPPPPKKKKKKKKNTPPPMKERIGKPTYTLRVETVYIPAFQSERGEKGVYLYVEGGKGVYPSVWGAKEKKKKKDPAGRVYGKHTYPKKSPSPSAPRGGGENGETCAPR